MRTHTARTIADLSFSQFELLSLIGHAPASVFRFNRFFKGAENFRFNAQKLLIGDAADIHINLAVRSNGVHSCPAFNGADGEGCFRIRRNLNIGDLGRRARHTA